MSVVEIEKLIAPVSGDMPGGADVEYDAEYFDLEKLFQGTPESVMGEEVKEGEEPDWPAVKAGALKLFDRTRDLRVAVILAVALLKTDGMAGFLDGVKVIKGLVDQLWDQVYPKLDPDDNNDPTIRINILKNLAGNVLGGDVHKVIPRLREAVLTNSKQRIGRFGYRDLQIAKGEVTPPPAKEGQAASATPELINAAFEDTSTEDLITIQEVVGGATDELKGLDKSLGEKVGAGNGPDLMPVVDLLKDIKGVLDEQLAKRGIGGEAPPGEGDAGGVMDAGGDAGGESAPVARPATVSGEVTSRQDVIRVLDKICTYYEKYEPGSPVPIFMKRAKRLVTMSFAELIKDLAPDANDRINIFVGEQEAAG